MSPASPHPCPDWMVEKFPPSGRLDFASWVDLCLYDPQHGYYRTDREPIGPGGDFVTSSSDGAPFARAISRIATELSQHLDGEELHLVDAGCGSGRFLAHLGEALRSTGGDADRWQLHGVEVGEGARRRAEGRLRTREISARLHAGPGSLPQRFDGLLFSYELFDALPFARLIGREDGTLGEEVVVLDRLEQTIRVDVDDPGPRVADLARSRGLSLAPGQEAEIAPAAAPLFRKLASRLCRGLVLTFDYGARRQALYSAVGRFHGTAHAHIDHRTHRGLLESPGRQDLTALVDFQALEEEGAEIGLVTAAFISQSRLLLGAGLGRELATGRLSPEEKAAALRAVVPGGAGETLRVLVQATADLSHHPWNFLNPEKF